jgi:hypothetical protein
VAADAGQVFDLRVEHDHGSDRDTLPGASPTSLDIVSLEDLQDDFGGGADLNTYLPLYSDRDRTVSMIVF